jgi:hypothetical protein
MRQDIARARKGDIPVPVQRVIPTPGASPTFIPSPKPTGKALKKEEHRIILLEKAHIKAAHCP